MEGKKKPYVSNVFIFVLLDVDLVDMCVDL